MADSGSARRRPGSATENLRVETGWHVEDLAVVALWVLAFAVGGPVCVVAVMGPPMALACGLVRLGMRAPGGLGRCVRAWERKDPGTPAAFLTCVQVLGLLVAQWTGLLGRLLRLVLVAGG